MRFSKSSLSLYLLFIISFCTASPFPDAPTKTSTPLSQQNITNSIISNTTTVNAELANFEDDITLRITSLRRDYPKLLLERVTLHNLDWNIFDVSQNQLLIDFWAPDRPSREAAIKVFSTSSIVGSTPTQWRAPTPSEEEPTLNKWELWIWESRQALSLNDALDKLREQFSGQGPWYTVTMSRNSAGPAPLKGRLQYQFMNTKSNPPVFVTMDAETGAAWMSGGAGVGSGGVETS